MKGELRRNRTPKINEPASVFFICRQAHLLISATVSKDTVKTLSERLELEIIKLFVSFYAAPPFSGRSLSGLFKRPSTVAAYRQFDDAIKSKQTYLTPLIQPGQAGIFAGPEALITRDFCGIPQRISQLCQPTVFAFTCRPLLI